MSFSFEPYEQHGLQTLTLFSGASKFNKWVYHTIKPYCKGDILEIGSGLGNISAFFIENQYPIVLSDVWQNYCEYLMQHFSVAPNCKGVIQLDLAHPEFDTLYASWFSRFDTVFALNVIEHISDDALAISNA